MLVLSQGRLIVPERRFLPPRPLATREAPNGHSDVDPAAVTLARALAWDTLYWKIPGCAILWCGSRDWTNATVGDLGFRLSRTTSLGRLSLPR